MIQKIKNPFLWFLFCYPTYTSSEVGLLRCSMFHLIFIRCRLTLYLSPIRFAIVVWFVINVTFQYKKRSTRIKLTEFQLFLILPWQYSPLEDDGLFIDKYLHMYLWIIKERMHASKCFPLILFLFLEHRKKGNRLFSWYY